MGITTQGQGKFTNCSNVGNVWGICTMRLILWTNRVLGTKLLIYVAGVSAASIICISISIISSTVPVGGFTQKG